MHVAMLEADASGNKPSGQFHRNMSAAPVIADPPMVEFMTQLGIPDSIVSRFAKEEFTMDVLLNYATKEDIAAVVAQAGLRAKSVLMAIYLRGGNILESGESFKLCEKAARHHLADLLIMLAMAACVVYDMTENTIHIHS